LTDRQGETRDYTAFDIASVRGFKHAMHLLESRHRTITTGETGEMRPLKRSLTWKDTMW